VQPSRPEPLGVTDLRQATRTHWYGDVSWHGMLTEGLWLGLVTSGFKLILTNFPIRVVASGVKYRVGIYPHLSRHRSTGNVPPRSDDGPTICPWIIFWPPSEITHFTSGQILHDDFHEAGITRREQTMRGWLGRKRKIGRFCQ
jgi:hypothetical protein